MFVKVKNSFKKNCNKTFHNACTKMYLRFFLLWTWTSLTLLLKKYSLTISKTRGHSHLAAGPVRVGWFPSKIQENSLNLGKIRDRYHSKMNDFSIRKDQVLNSTFCENKAKLETLLLGWLEGPFFICLNYLMNFCGLARYLSTVCERGYWPEGLL